MNNEKAREFFTAYYEGALENGLRQALEQKLRSDAVLSGDYAAFVETMRELDELKFEHIEVPTYLRDRIATRLEQIPVPSAYTLAGLWRGLGLAGLAAGVIGIAFLASRDNRSIDNVAVGGVVPAQSVNADQLNFNYKDGQVVLSYRPTRPKSVVVSSGTTGVELKRYQLNGNVLESPIVNPLEEAALFSIRVEGETGQSMLALPGSKRSTEKTGNGTLVDLALALASYYKVPVLVQAPDADRALSWDFEAATPRDAAAKALGGQSDKVDQRPSGMLVIL